MTEKPSKSRLIFWKKGDAKTKEKSAKVASGEVKKRGRTKKEGKKKSRDEPALIEDEDKPLTSKRQTRHQAKQGKEIYAEENTSPKKKRKALTEEKNTEEEEWYSAEEEWNTAEEIWKDGQMPKEKNTTKEDRHRMPVMALAHDQEAATSAPRRCRRQGCTCKEEKMLKELGARPKRPTVPEQGAKSKGPTLARSQKRQENIQPRQERPRTSEGLWNMLEKAEQGTNWMEQLRQEDLQRAEARRASEAAFADSYTSSLVEQSFQQEPFHWNSSVGSDEKKSRVEATVTSGDYQHLQESGYET